VALNVRKAELEDSAALARIQVDSYRTAYAGIFPQAYLDRFTYEEQEEDWRDLIASDPEDLLLLAGAEAGEIAGYALGRPGLTSRLFYEWVGGKLLAETKESGGVIEVAYGWATIESLCLQGETA
jgi:hypothetical protein